MTVVLALFVILAAILLTVLGALHMVVAFARLHERPSSVPQAFLGSVYLTGAVYITAAVLGVHL